MDGSALSFSLSVSMFVIGIIVNAGIVKMKMKNVDDLENSAISSRNFKMHFHRD